MSSKEHSEQLMQRLEAVSEAMAKGMVKVIEDTVKSCVTCDHFSEVQCVVFKDETRTVEFVKPQCGLNGLQPPARVIAFGCECWEDKIPF